MAPVKQNAAQAKVHTSFSSKPKNVEVLITVLLSCKTPGAFGLDSSQVDWDVVAKRLNLKGPNSASTRFSQVKKELLNCAEAIRATGDSDTTDDGVATPPETPKKGTTQKALKRKGIAKRGSKPKAKKVNYEESDTETDNVVDPQQGEETRRPCDESGEDS